ncbi:hypothetical protein EZV73_01045 [Acidaminobacter sp. JC074]|uniref:hypothetical protein n=1 Tax=Acidaminobacter sp. JC074 TaxID=2530199 RepID=UPI001F0EC400|nr:hypothetical protein [Acidaminobacter sp. JC074]MCH4886128.1 hypothetical protein [Acidaminobacter sp. JC074]
MFEKEIKQLEESIINLKLECRYDDAKLDQIRLNVYKHISEIKVYTDTVSIDLKDQLQAVKVSWQESLDLAVIHDDEDKAMAERVKLETLEDVLERI